MNGAQALIESLKREGVTHIFGYAGATICPAVDALKDVPEIGYTLVRTEQNAGHMASGYARVSGKVGVCMVTSGPGATNLITGIATAYMDSIPMVAITGQVPSHLLGRDIFQEVDITGAVAPFSKHSYLVKDPNQIPRVVREAFHIASTGRPGPVLIDIPIDVQEQSLKHFDWPEEVAIRGYKPSVKGNDLQIKRVVEAIGRAKQPIICAGGGVWLAGAQKELLELAEGTGIPVVKTMMGISLMPTRHPLNMGMIGAHGNHCANKALAKSDLLIMVGTRAADRAIIQPDEIQRRMATIHIDVDPAENGKNMQAAVHQVAGPAGRLPEGGAEPYLPQPPRVYLPRHRHAEAGGAAGGQRRCLRGRGPESNLYLQILTSEARPSPHQRRPGHHGLRPARRGGGKGGPAGPADSGGLR